MTDVLKPLSENTSIPSGIVPVVVTSGPVSRTLTVRATLMRDKGLKTITEGNSLNVSPTKPMEKLHPAAGCTFLIRRLVGKITLY